MGVRLLGRHRPCGQEHRHLRMLMASGIVYSRSCCCRTWREPCYVYRWSMLDLVYGWELAVVLRPTLLTMYRTPNTTGWPPVSLSSAGVAMFNSTIPTGGSYNWRKTTTHQNTLPGALYHKYKIVLLPSKSHSNSSGPFTAVRSLEVLLRLPKRRYPTAVLHLSQECHIAWDQAAAFNPCEGSTVS